MIEQRAPGFGSFCVTDVCDYAGGGGVETGEKNKAPAQGGPRCYSGHRLGVSHISMMKFQPECYGLIK